MFGRADGGGKVNGCQVRIWVLLPRMCHAGCGQKGPARLSKHCRLWSEKPSISVSLSAACCKLGATRFIHEIYLWMNTLNYSSALGGGGGGDSTEKHQFFCFNYVTAV